MEFPALCGRESTPKFQCGLSSPLDVVGYDVGDARAGVRRSGQIFRRQDGKPHILGPFDREDPSVPRRNAPRNVETTALSDAAGSARSPRPPARWECRVSVRISECRYGAVGLLDASCTPHRQSTSTPVQVVRRIEQRRRDRSVSVTACPAQLGGDQVGTSVALLYAPNW